LEIIRKPSIKPSPESTSIYMPEDPASAKVPPPDGCRLRAEGSCWPAQHGWLDEGVRGYRL
jgi:hypothetical protein